MKRTRQTDTAPRTTPRQGKRPRRQVPRGLRAIFSAMQSFDYRNQYGATTPEPFLDVLRALENVERGSDFGKALDAAAHKEFPGSGFGPKGNQRASECAEV